MERYFLWNEESFRKQFVIDWLFSSFLGRSESRLFVSWFSPPHLPPSNFSQLTIIDHDHRVLFIDAIKQSFLTLGS